MALHESPSLDPSGPPNVLADLRPHQRKAFELCAVVLDAFRRCEADPLEEALKEGLERARKLAEIELRTQNSDVPIATFLANSLAKVVQTVQESAEAFPLNEAGQQALNLLSRLQTTLFNDPDLVCQMKAAFAECHAAAQTLYSASLTPPYQLPKISLRIYSADEENKALPGRKIAFNGSVHYEDEANAKHSVVRLTVYPLLNSGCLPALPYILMHEILCHWPQMLRCPGARPNPGKLNNPLDKNAARFEIDPFSEGWIDSLVAEALRHHFGDADAAHAEEAQTAEDIHNERTIYNRHPSFEDAARIAPGSQAARWVRWFYNADTVFPMHTADPDFWSLSSELNVAAWNYEERRKGCNALLGACRAYDWKQKHGKELSERHASILEALRRFRRDHDPTQMLRALAQD
jgi:hypothetical protein